MTVTSATSSLISSLGAGSGIDMAALATSLAEAQFAARSDRLASRKDQIERQISAASEIRGKLLELSSAVASRIRSGDLAPLPTIADPAVATVSPVPGIRPAGSYSLEVLSLASAQTLATGAFASASDPVGAGTLTLRFGTLAGSSFAEDANHPAATISIAAGATLADVAVAINGSGSGVSAYVATGIDGAHLVLKGKDGAASGFVIEASGDPALAALAWSPGAGEPGRLLAAAGDAHFKLDGIERASASNAISSAAPGISLALTAINIGVPTRIGVTDPSAAIPLFMADFTAALNEIAATLKPATDPKTGDLARDTGARALRETLSRLAGATVMSGAAADAPRTLADLGLATQRDGTFKLDESRLAATLQRAPEAVAAMFTNGLHGVFATIDNLARDATSIANPGSLATSIERLSTQQRKVGEEIADVADRQDALRASLAKRFAVADSRVGAFKSTLGFLQAQINAWNAPKQ